ncbi:MAG: hypothetical protein WC869_01805 [Phycisphaerae bacterium]|jgi:flagellar motility protein MotE (MotC chaperone)
MKKIGLLVIIVVLAAGSFTLSMMIFKRKAVKAHPAPPVAAASQPATDAASAEANALTLAPPVAASGKEKQLDDLSLELRGKLDACKKREVELEQRERHMKMAEDTLKKQAEELETLRMQLVTPLAALKDAQAELERSRLAIRQQEKTQLKRTATIYDKMDPASSSKIIEGMINGQQEDDAARILHFMSDRSAAKLLSEMSDKTLVVRLCDRMKKIKEEE